MGTSIIDGAYEVLSGDKMIGKLDQALDFNAKSLLLRSQRQQLISSNLANAETPNYKAVDIDFSQTLLQATQSSAFRIGTEPLALRTTHFAHLQADTMSAGIPLAIRYRTPSQPSIDGNSVDPDLEKAQFADNTMRYEAGLRILNGQLRGLQTVIQGNS